jgi:hypothetical protein
MSAPARNAPPQTRLRTRMMRAAPLSEASVESHMSDHDSDKDLSDADEINSNSSFSSCDDENVNSTFACRMCAKSGIHTRLTPSTLVALSPSDWAACKDKSICPEHMCVLRGGASMAPVPSDTHVVCVGQNVRFWKRRRVLYTIVSVSRDEAGLVYELQQGSCKRFKTRERDVSKVEENLSSPVRAKEVVSPRLQPRLAPTSALPPFSPLPPVPSLPLASLPSFPSRSSSPEY